jgi:hypothetical protein
VLAGVSAKRTSHLGRLRLLLELVDLPLLSDGLTMHGVLEPFDHCFEVGKSFLEVLETPGYGQIRLAVTGRDACWLSAQPKLTRHTSKRSS